MKGFDFQPQVGHLGEEVPRLRAKEQGVIQGQVREPHVRGSTRRFHIPKTIGELLTKVTSNVGFGITRQGNEW